MIESKGQLREACYQEAELTFYCFDKKRSNEALESKALITHLKGIVLERYMNKAQT